MIYLVTGQPGHGKTLRALWMARKEREEGRVVYACRVRGLDHEATGFKELVSLSEWQSLPDGSVVLVDECYEDIPARGQGKGMPDWEKALATHRHRGFDFILICQLGTQISTFVRGLVDRHVHVRRKFGFEKAVLLEWDRYQSNVSSDAEGKSARRSMWSYPRDVFALYQSAEVHTVKRSLPWQVLAIPVLLIVVAGCLWWVFHDFEARGKPQKTPGESAAPAARNPASPQQPTAPMTAEQYLQQMVPRVPGMPWSAPWHDAAKPKAEPDILCVASEIKGCQCYTEQITRLKVSILDCYQIAKNGIYNPFRAAATRSLNTRYEAERPTSVASTH